MIPVSGDGMVVWFTGLSGAGKTTLAVSVERRLFNGGYRTFLLDGDSMRASLSSDLGFSAADRRENIRRAGVVSEWMASAGLICLTSLIFDSFQNVATAERTV